MSQNFYNNDNNNNTTRHSNNSIHNDDTMIMMRKPTTSRKRHHVTSPSDEIIIPTEMDILCGKEKPALSHSGTKKYRSLIEAYQPSYEEAIDKQAKMAITKEIVTRLGKTSRFLRYNRQTQAYEELTQLEARDKTSHALRTACKRERRLRSQQQQHSSSNVVSFSSNHSNNRHHNNSPSLSRAPLPRSPIVSSSAFAAYHSNSHHNHNSNTHHHHHHPYRNHATHNDNYDASPSPPPLDHDAGRWGCSRMTDHHHNNNMYSYEPFPLESVSAAAARPRNEAGAPTQRRSSSKEVLDLLESSSSNHSKMSASSQGSWCDPLPLNAPAAGSAAAARPDAVTSRSRQWSSASTKSWCEPLPLTRGKSRDGPADKEMFFEGLQALLKNGSDHTTTSAAQQEPREEEARQQQEQHE